MGRLSVQLILILFRCRHNFCLYSADCLYNFSWFCVDCLYNFSGYCADYLNDFSSWPTACTTSLSFEPTVCTILLVVFTTTPGLHCGCTMSTSADTVPTVRTTSPGFVSTVRTTFPSFVSTVRTTSPGSVSTVYTTHFAGSVHWGCTRRTSWRRPHCKPAQQRCYRCFSFINQTYIFLPWNCCCVKILSVGSELLFTWLDDSSVIAVVCYRASAHIIFTTHSPKGIQCARSRYIDLDLYPAIPILCTVLPASCQHSSPLISDADNAVKGDRV